MHTCRGRREKGGGGREWEERMEEKLLSVFKINEKLKTNKILLFFKIMRIIPGAISDFSSCICYSLPRFKACMLLLL